MCHALEMLMNQEYLGEEISGDAVVRFDPLDFKLLLANTVAKPVEAEVDGLDAGRFEGIVAEDNCTGVVAPGGC